nr:integrase, catalytic region, zinc finger, CCHC-type, peptidase aspartic, catalytic [Tanacetum cinerariifolium]
MGMSLDEEQLLFLAGGQDNAIDEDVDEQPVQDLALNVDNVFQANDCDAFDSDVDEAPTTQTMFMANLSSANPVYDEAGPSYDSDILSEYVKENALPGVQSNVSSILNDAYMMIYNDMYEPHAQSVSKTSQNTVVDNSLTVELATSKEQVELYERRARFELTEREQQIDEQLRIVITDSNFKEETLKKELHSVKLQIASTINHNKLMVEEVTSLKNDFKQKENKYLEDFLDMKYLKEKVAIGYKNPLCLTRAKQVQPALYNVHEIIKNNHVPAIVYNIEDTLEIAKITRRKMNDKMKDPEYLINMKTEALKEQTTASRPIKALTVYPPNIPTTLVPRVLPTKSQVKIHIFTLIQLFLEFDKTCKKRITPTGITKGERGFEQTKECYLKKMFFEELEAEVAQNDVDRKHDEIEWKNILISNDNLVVECLSKEVFYVAMNSKLNVSRFTEMHVAHTIVKPRCLELEAELSNLHDKIHNDNHNKLVNRFSNLEVHHLNLQLKYQNLKDSFENNPPTPAKDTLDFDSVFVIGKMQASLQGKDNIIKQLKKQISHLQETHSEVDRTLDFWTLDSQITQLTEKVTVLQAQNDLVSKDHVKPTVLAPGKYVIDVEPIPSCLRNNREARLDYLKHLKESVETIREIVEEAKVVQIVLWYLDSCCSKHMMEDRSRLMNFVKKFIGTVRFRNDHFGAIMGYGDYVIGDSVILRIYYVEGLGHNMFSVKQFCDSDLEVALRKHSCYV